MADATADMVDTVDMVVWATAEWAWGYHLWADWAGVCYWDQLWVSLTSLFVCNFGLSRSLLRF